MPLFKFLTIVTSFFIVLDILGYAGPVVMKMHGFTEKGFKRKLAVQALFGKIYYLSEVMNVETVLLLERICLLFQHLQ